MKWDNDSKGDMCLTMSPEAAVIVADILKTKIAVLASRRERYHDNIANGASEKYARLYDAADKDFDTACFFIRLVDEYQKAKKRR